MCLHLEPERQVRVRALGRWRDVLGLACAWVKFEPIVAVRASTMADIHPETSLGR
jgi:hypothetical protein